MRSRLLPVLIFPLLLTVPAGAQGLPSWQIYTSKEGCFTVLLPTTPVVKTEPPGLGTPGRVDYEATMGSYSLLVTYLDYPASASATSPADKERILETAALKSISSCNWELVEKRSVRLATTSGHEFLTRSGSIVHRRCRVFMVGSRVYHVMISGTRDQVTSGDADSFLDSFRLTSTPPPPPVAKDRTPQLFRSTELRFSAQFLGTPRVEKTVVMESPRVVMHQFVAAAGNLTQLVNVTVPDGPQVPLDPSDALESFGKSMAQNLQSSVVTEKRLPGKYAGRELLLRSEAGFSTRLRLYLVNSTIYQVITGGFGEEASTAESLRFLESFRLND